MKKSSQPQFYKDLTRKTAFIEGWSGFKFSNLGLTLGTNLKFYTSVEKGLNLRVRKFWRLIRMFVDITGKNLVAAGGGGAGGLCCKPPLSAHDSCLYKNTLIQSIKFCPNTIFL